MPLKFLCLASYYKGNPFLEACKDAGHQVYLLTIEKVLHEAWPRHKIDQIYALPDFVNRRSLINSVAYLFREHNFDRIVALDDFDVEVAAQLREHFRLTHVGHGESEARFFRDKLAMRAKAKEIGVRIPEFTALANDQEINAFLDRVPGPWLIKPRSEASAAGIRKLHHRDDVWRRVHELGDDRSFQLLEQMVPGDLYHVDSLTLNGQVIFAEVNAYQRPLLDVYQGGGIYATRTVPRDRPDVPELRAINSKLLTGFGLGYGASHTEFMKAHHDGQFYFIETSSRVGGADTAIMVEQATGVNLWSEWAKLEVARTEPGYQLPKQHERYAGVVISLARQEWPDDSGFNDPEIVHRHKHKYHIGFVVAADQPNRVQELLNNYMDRIARDYHAVLPAADSVAH
jgi:hypothetical protein